MDSSLGAHKQNLACTKTQGKGAVTPQETELDLPAGVGEAWINSGSPWGQGHWQQQSWKGFLDISPLRGCH